MKILLGLAAALVAGLVLFLAGRDAGSRDGAVQAEQAHDGADVVQLQAKGAADQLLRTAHATSQATDAAAIAAAFAGQAQTSEEADAPLSDDRARRLRDSDVQLCALRPELAGCAPAP